MRDKFDPLKLALWSLMVLTGAALLFGCITPSATREARFLGTEPPTKTSEQVYACAMHEREFWCFPIETLLERMDVVPRRSPSEERL